LDESINDENSDFLRLCYARCEEDLWSNEYHECVRAAKEVVQGRSECEHLLLNNLTIYNESGEFEAVLEDDPGNVFVDWLCDIGLFDIRPLSYFKDDFWSMSWDTHLAMNCPLTVTKV